MTSISDPMLKKGDLARWADAPRSGIGYLRAGLRKWEQSTWPEDDLTVEANRDDLAKLERQQGAAVAQWFEDNLEGWEAMMDANEVSLQAVWQQ